MLELKKFSTAVLATIVLGSGRDPIAFRREKRAAGGHSGLWFAVDDLCRRTYLCGRIEEVYLQPDSQVSTFPPDNVILIAWSDGQGVQITARDRSSVERLALKCKCSSERGGAVRIERTDRYVKMVLTSKLPLQLPREGRVIPGVERHLVAVPLAIE